jgi:hypothetical protein
MNEFYVMENVGSAKYVVNYYSGHTYPDGSKFYDIKICKNKKQLRQFENNLLKNGYMRR